MPLSGPRLDAPVNLLEILSRGLEAKPDELALISQRARWTWRELDQLSTRYAKNLINLGLRKGDRVASLMPNRDSLIIHYLACVKSGLVMTPLNYHYTAPEIDHVLEVTEASVLLAHAERDQDLAASEHVPRLPLGVISYGADDVRSPSFEELLDATSPDLALPTASASDPAVIFFTSGSTGKPKGVTHSYETYGWLLAAAVKGSEATAGDVVLPGLSVSHEGGHALSFTGFAVGARVLIAHSFDAGELLTLLREARPTLILTFPAILIALVRNHDATREDFDSLRLCLVGGDKVTAELEREFADLTCSNIYETYGMTEIGLSNISPPSGVNKLGSVGPVNAGYTLSIRDDSGNELPAGEEGRLWVKSPATMVGYWNRPDATAETIVDGWLDTGDLFRADEDSYLWFCGRRKQIIVHDGSNISPQEVEDSLLAHPGVQAACVVGVHDPVHGENVWAFISYKEGVERPTSQELIDFSRSRVGYKAPEVIEMLEKLPLNATGKVDRVTLKKLAADRVTAERPD
jgi:acyl-coenzyme A synthetase/AMP-(fatty) acid ligase